MAQWNWKNEPDMLSWKTGEYHCVILRNWSGILCGYVGVKEDHPLYGKDYYDLGFSCHGGLTYSGNSVMDKDRWYIGFDCAHAFDYIPGLEEELKKMEEETDLFFKTLGVNLKKLMGIHKPQYRNIEYVREQISILMLQCIEYKQEKATLKNLEELLTK